MNEEEVKNALISQLDELDRNNCHGPRFRELRTKLKEWFGVDWQRREE